MRFETSRFSSWGVSLALAVGSVSGTTASAQQFAPPRPTVQATPAVPSRALPVAPSRPEPGRDTAIKRTVVLVADGLPAMPSLPDADVTSTIPTTPPGATYDGSLAAVQDTAVPEPGTLAVPTDQPLSEAAEEIIPGGLPQLPSAPLPQATEGPGAAIDTAPAPVVEMDTTAMDAQMRRPTTPLFGTGGAAATSAPGSLAIVTTTSGQSQQVPSAQGSPQQQGPAPGHDKTCTASGCKPRGWGGASHIAQGTGQILGGFGNILKGTGKMMGAGLHCLGNKTEHAFDKGGNLLHGCSHAWHKVGEGCAKLDHHQHQHEHQPPAVTASSQQYEAAPSLLTPQSP